MEPRKRQEQYTQVIRRAWDDSEFKKSLIANPVETMEAEIGRKLDIPEGKTLVVLDQVNANQVQTDANQIYFVIPERNLEDIELTESQLESIAGGFTIEYHYNKYNECTGWSLNLTI